MDINVTSKENKSDFMFGKVQGQIYFQSKGIFQTTMYWSGGGGERGGGGDVNTVSFYRDNLSYKVITGKPKQFDSPPEGPPQS